MQLIDTHCHIHEAPSAHNANDATHALWLKADTRDADKLLARAADKGVTQVICVGTTAEDSQRAIDFVQTRPNTWASIGLHPHEAKHLKGSIPILRGLLANENIKNSEASGGREEGTPSTRSGTPRGHDGRSLEDRTRGGALENSNPPSLVPQGSPPLVLAGVPAAASGVPSLRATRGFAIVGAVGLAERKIIAIGECGLDYFYNHSNKKDQKQALRAQLELAVEHNLPLIFHVREAFDDFWPIFDGFKGLHGVLHSFTDDQPNLHKALERNLFIGVNGIMTFTKDSAQLDVAKAIPLTHLLLETDAPFLTPVPFRGRVNEPAHCRLVAEFLANLRGESLAELANQTSANAQTLFSLK